MSKKKESAVGTALPAPKRVSKYGINWDDYALTAKLLGQPVLAGKNIKDTQVKALRLYKRPPFITDEGRIVVHLRNSEVKSDGKRYGDVYFVWEPTTTTEESK